MPLDPHSAQIAVVTLGAGYLMVVAGLHKSLLERRRPTRLCPGCGRVLTARVCSACRG